MYHAKKKKKKSCAFLFAGEKQNTSKLNQSSRRVVCRKCPKHNVNSLWVMCNMRSNEHLNELIPTRNVHDAERLPFLRLNFEFYVLAASSSNSLISVWPFHFFSSIVRLQKEGLFFFFSMKSVFTLSCHSWLLWLMSFSFNLEYFFVSSNSISLRPSPPSHSLST